MVISVLEIIIKDSSIAVPAITGIGRSGQNLEQKENQEEQF